MGITPTHNCLYFTANALSRLIGKMADDAFAPTGLSPAHAFLMMLVNDRPGISQKELAEALSLAPSTVTRFVDALERRGFLTREMEGKLSRVSPTEAGLGLKETIAAGWSRLHALYSEELGAEAAEELTRAIDDANQQLEMV